MKDKNIDVLMIVAGVKPCKVNIRGTANNLKYLVNPNLSFMANAEAMMLEKDVALVYNNEGALLGLKGNRKIGSTIIAGTFFIVGIKCGEIASLTKDNLEKYSKRFEKIETYSDSEVSASYWDYWTNKLNDTLE